MRTYLLLKERAAAFRADPEVAGGARGRAACTSSSEPTSAAGETYDDLLADRRRSRTSTPTRPPRAATASCALDQLAIEHLLGAALSGTECHARRRGRLLDPVVQGRRPRRATPGRLVARGSRAAPRRHRGRPGGWWSALRAAVGGAGGLDDVAAVAVGGQQHGMVLPRRRRRGRAPALLWNDTRSAARPRDLIAELGGAAGVGRRGRLGPGGVVHGDQAALARRARARRGRPGRRRSACRTTG